MRKAAWSFVLILSGVASRLSANPTECRESEYLDVSQRQCVPCKECGPGLELSKDCGYGEGSDAQCTPCRPRRFKDSWGRHGCKPCLSCVLINRTQKANCTATADAVCGECFPGFYRKAQIGGSRDQECVPCTKRTPSSERQCHSSVSLVKVEEPPAPAQDLVLVMLTSSALVIIALLLLTASIVYCRPIWKSRCQPGAEVPHFHLSGQHSDQDGPGLIPAGPRALVARKLLETHPLIRSSGCSDGSAGGFSLPDPGCDSRGVPSCPAPVSSCATDMHRCWPHAPVECTELDLQTFSSQEGCWNAEDAGMRDALTGPRGRPAATLRNCPCFAYPGTEPQLSLEPAQGPFSSFRHPTAESGEQVGEDSQCLVTKIGHLTHGLPIARLPDSLVLSLGLQLDPALPGIKNFSHLGLELGVLPAQLGRMSGFKELVTHLGDCGSSVPVLFLAQSLQKLQRSDALRLLFDHVTANQIPD